jgi:hypothetical protein
LTAVVAGSELPSLPQHDALTVETFLRAFWLGFARYGEDFFRAFLGMAVWRCLPEFMLGILTARILGSRAAEWLGAHRWTALGLCLSVLVLISIPRADLAVVLLFPPLIVCRASDTNLPSRLLPSKPSPLDRDFAEQAKEGTVRHFSCRRDA